jgi:hypothetical protein
LTAALVAAGALALVGCSTVSTGASEVALEYGGGAFDSPSFVKCFNGGYKSTTEGASDTYKYYPTGQRDFSFGDDKGLDSAALTSTTRDSQEVKVTGTVKFVMNLSCKPFKDATGKTWPGGTAQYFHEVYGDKDHAYNDEGSKPVGDGWTKMLRQYMGFAIDREVDDNALNFQLTELNTDRTAKDKWEDEVKKGLPATLKSMTGGVEVFRINDVLLQRPGVRPEIADANAEKQAAQIRADAVEIDKTAAANFPGGIAGYQAYQQQQAVNEAIKAGKVKVIPIPQGSPVIVSGN